MVGVGIRKGESEHRRVVVLPLLPRGVDKSPLQIGAKRTAAGVVAPVVAIVRVGDSCYWAIVAGLRTERPTHKHKAKSQTFRDIT